MKMYLGFENEATEATFLSCYSGGGIDKHKMGDVLQLTAAGIGIDMLTDWWLEIIAIVALFRLNGLGVLRPEVLESLEVLGSQYMSVELARETSEEYITTLVRLQTGRIDLPTHLITTLEIK